MVQEVMLEGKLLRPYLLINSNGFEKEIRVKTNLKEGNDNTLMDVSGINNVEGYWFSKEKNINLEESRTFQYPWMKPDHFKTDKHLIDFGLCHTNECTILKLWISNKSYVPAHWKIVYVPYPDKKYHGAATVTREEKED